MPPVHFLSVYQYNHFFEFENPELGNWIKMSLNIHEMTLLCRKLGNIIPVNKCPQGITTDEHSTILSAENDTFRCFCFPGRRDRHAEGRQEGELSKETLPAGVSLYPSVYSAGCCFFVLSSVRLDLCVPRLSAAFSDYGGNFCGPEMVPAYLFQPGPHAGCAQGDPQHVCHEWHIAAVLLVSHGLCRVSQ